MTVGENVFLREEAAFVAGARVAHLATVRGNGRPHVVPISPVLELNRLVFASRRDAQKVRNILGNPWVAINADEYHEDWNELVQVVMQGEAYVLEPGFEHDRDRTLLYEKFAQYEAMAPIDEDWVIVETRIDRVTSTWRWRDA